MLAFLEKYNIAVAIVFASIVLAAAHLVVNRYGFRTVSIGDNPFWVYEVKADKWTGRQCAASGLQQFTIERGLPYCN